ncbi:MAG: GFA family protein [Novosphingobium sp.]|nr:GFA family protein [Novosphingobium sp.]
MSYSGKCACGAVTATIDAQPLALRQCWCRQCQKIAAGGATMNATFPTDAIAIEGEMGTHDFTSASGNTLTQFFCPNCATPIMGRSSGRPHLSSVRFGFLDTGHGLRPEAAIWTSELPDWACLDPSLDAYPEQAPAPAPQGGN